MKKILALLTVLMLMATAAFAEGAETGTDTQEAGESAAMEMTTLPDMPDENGGTPPEKPEGDMGTPPERPEGDMGTPPEKPEGDMGTPPEKPEGDMGTPPEKPEGDMGTPPEMPGDGNGMGTPPGGFGGNTAPGESADSIEYSAAQEISEAAEITGLTCSSETADESALLISTEEAVSLKDLTVSKTGDSDGGDSCNFYGLNAAVLVMGGSTTTISGAQITSDADGANGVFGYGGNGGRNGVEGDGTTVVISDSTITTTGDGSGGIMTTGGGVTYATNLTVETSGRSSAAIRTDRGGGTVVVEGGIYTSSGLGSPAIYSTADITVTGASLTSNLSEGVCIEGKNSITLVDCELTANNTQLNGNATFLDTIMIYQSMSGDADSGTSAFTMTGGSLTSLNGHMFHVTNTNAVITLSGVNLINEGSDVLLSVCSDGWHGAGNVATLNADAQALAGTLLVGEDASLTLNLTNGSTFEGTVSGEIYNAKGEEVSTAAGTVNVVLDETSTWILTADTYITSFEGSLENVIGDYALYVNGVQVNE